MNGLDGLEVMGTLGAALLLTGGAVMTLVAWRASRRRGVQRLRTVLEEGVEDAQDPSLAATWSAMVRAAENLGSGSGLYALIGDRLRRAGWTLGTGEFVVTLAVLGVAGAVVGEALSGEALALALGLGLPLGAYLTLGVRADRYARRCDDQLPDALTQLAAAMRSGHSLQQAMESLAEHGRDPLAGEMRRVMADTVIGVPLDESLQAMADRVGSPDLRWTVRAMIIQRRTGGRLADVLEVLAEFMRDRTEVRREVRALTAEGRISALILMGLPFVVLGGVLLTNAAYLDPLVQEPIGRVMAIGAVVSMGIAWFLMRNIIKVEV